MSKLLYIGLNGYAGAGKDTVAKMLKVLLNKIDVFSNIDEFNEFYKNTHIDPTKSATFNAYNYFENDAVLCIAYADQLKEICSTMFGIPIERFYMNKSNAWICINDKFQYTEIKPAEDRIMTADEYYYSSNSINEDDTSYWMSLREILVYVGTYVLQRAVNKRIFVNIVRNKIKEAQRRNPFLKYVIITDNRFSHELEFIHENNGITMTIVRDSILQLDNIAEHDLDDVQSYDYVVDNSGTYDELIQTVWDIVKQDIEFSNQIEELYTRDNVDNYLRLVNKTDGKNVYKLCAPLGMQQIYGSGESYTAINPIGGPMICVDSPIDGTRTTARPEGLIPYRITFYEETSTYYIYTKSEI